MKTENCKKSIAFLCGGYRSIYSGNFIPSLKAIESKLDDSYNCVYIFHKGIDSLDWCKELIKSGHIVETMDFDANLLKRIKQIKNICKKHNIVLIHFHFGDKLAATLYGMFHKVEIVWHIHTDGSCGKKGIHGIKDIIVLLKAFVGNKIIGCRAKKISESEDLAKKEKAVCIPNGIGFERVYRMSADEIKLNREKIGIDPQALQILLFGWSLDIKGLDLAYDAVSHLYEKGKNVNLLVVCGVDNTIQKEYLKTKCGYQGNEKFIHFLPPIEDVFLYHNISDIFLSASRSEGFPYSVLEALSIGKPCVASDIKGTEWCREFYNTEFFESNNTSSLIDALKRMCERMQKGDVDPEKDIQLIKDKYSVETMAERVVAAYQLDGKE